MDKFYLFFSFFILIAVVMTITSFNPIHSVFWLVLVFIQSAFLLVSIGFEFIGLMLIIIYVGAIAILFLFVIMMLDILQLSKISRVYHIFPILFILTSQLIVIYFNAEFSENHWYWLWNNNLLDQIHSLGISIYSDFSLMFILISVLLLIAMVGAIVLTLESGEITRRQILTYQHQRNNSWT